jgi:hypothetical protein
MYSCFVYTRRSNSLPNTTIVTAFISLRSVIDPPPLPRPSLTSSTQITPLSLPPEGIFDSFELLYAACQRHAKAAGYAFVTAKSEKRGGRVIKTLACKRGGIHQPKVNEDHRIRNKSTFKTNCQASLKAREGRDGSWALQHRESSYCVHNHEPGDPSAFHQHRQLSKEQLSTVSSHYSNGIAPSRTVAILQQQDPTLNLHHRDVYNIAAVISRARRQNTSPPEAFIALLEAEKAANKVYFEWRHDSAGHIAMFFIADICHDYRCCASGIQVTGLGPCCR